MSYEEIEIELKLIRSEVEEYLKAGKSLFATSSFQSHSIPMLHILSEIDNTIPIYFINTGYHFPDSLRFRDEIQQLLNINVVDLKSLIPKNLQKDTQGKLYYASDPDYCCFLNKTQPMEPLLLKHDVWVNGIRADQNANRKNMGREQNAPNNSLRYHPMLNWTNKMIFQYSSKFKLPKHPLEAKGYLSIGCEPCTQKFDFENSREGRWKGMKKTECGLHTDLVSK